MSAKPKSTLQFLGAAGTVTGSRYLVEHRGQRVLVDCGLFQGYKVLRDRNRLPFPVPPGSIDAVILTHAHLDHTGYLPALIKAGYRGPVYCTAATAELGKLILLDSGHLQEEEAQFAARKGFSRHAHPEPLYTVKDARTALERLEIRPFHDDFTLADGISARFVPAGHLLGAAQIRMTVGDQSLHFSGDLGRAHDPMLFPPDPLEETDYLVCESTYGNRSHPRIDAETELATAVRRVAKRGGVLMVPAFAVGRAQGLMLGLSRLRDSGAIPDIPVFLNSPMAVDATEIYHAHHEEHHISRAECQAMFDMAIRVNSVEQSKALNRRHGPMIIISASGMLTGGRILHHLAAFGPDPRNAVLLAGFQAGGTRGAALASGAETLRIFGQDVPIRAEVINLQGFSGHADADELIGWMRPAGRAPRMTWLTHGEPDGADVLRKRIRDELGWPSRAAEHLETVDLDHPR